MKLENCTESIFNFITYTLQANNSFIHSVIKCRSIDAIIEHFNLRDSLDIDLAEHLLQQYIQDHKKALTKVYE